MYFTSIVDNDNTLSDRFYLNSEKKLIFYNMLDSSNWIWIIFRQLRSKERLKWIKRRRKFPFWNHFDESVKNKTNPFSNRCSFCPKTYSLGSLVYRHCNVAHSAQVKSAAWYACSICGLYFPTKNTLDLHKVQVRAWFKSRIARVIVLRVSFVFQFNLSSMSKIKK